MTALAIESVLLPVMIIVNDYFSSSAIEKKIKIILIIAAVGFSLIVFHVSAEIQEMDKNKNR